MRSDIVHTFYVPRLCLLWPDNGCITAETCCLEVNYRVFISLLMLYVVSLDDNKIEYYYSVISLNSACRQVETIALYVSTAVED
jgi:hypothetical protein